MRKYSFVEAITIIITEGRICSKPAIKCEQINLLLDLLNSILPRGTNYLGSIRLSIFLNICLVELCENFLTKQWALMPEHENCVCSCRRNIFVQPQAVYLLASLPEWASQPQCSLAPATLSGTTGQRKWRECWVQSLTSFKAKHLLLLGLAGSEVAVVGIEL